MKRQLLAIAVFAACGGIESTPPSSAQRSNHYSLEQQKADVATRNALRKAAYDPDLRAKVAPSEWIAYAYHGNIVDANFDPVVLDDKTIAVIQQSTFDQLYPTYGKVASAKYGDMGELFAAKNLNPRERAEARQTALDGLISVADASHVERLGWRINTLRGGIASWQWQYKISQAALDWILSHGVAVWTPPPGQRYVDDCRAQGVPIPPDWPDDQWQRRGELAFNFLGSQTATVYTYTPEDGSGICFALPRDEAGRPSQFVGMICQNRNNGKACFWDNIARDESRRLTPSDWPLRIGSIGDGYTLSENCTDCHRGDNVFNIHPGSALDVGDIWTRALVRYTAIGGPAFVNPPPIALAPAPPDQLACTGCHTLPTLSRRYCDSVLIPAARFTMPAGFAADGNVAAGWPPSAIRPDYLAHILALKDACDSTP